MLYNIFANLCKSISKTYGNIVIEQTFLPPYIYSRSFQSQPKMLKYYQISSLVHRAKIKQYNTYGIGGQSFNGVVYAVYNKIPMNGSLAY